MTENTNHEKDTELESLLNAARARIKELESQLEEATNGGEAEDSGPLPISKYKVGDYVQIKSGTLLDFEDGRIVEFLAGKSAVIVATAKGEFSVTAPERIRKQGTN